MQQATKLASIVLLGLALGACGSKKKEEDSKAKDAAKKASSVLNPEARAKQAGGDMTEAEKAELKKAQKMLKGE